MIILCRRSPIASYLIFSLGCFLISAFFIYQIFKHDTLGQIRDNKKILAEKIERYDQIKGELLRYDALASSLSPHSLDKDLLTEEVRSKLLYTKKNEIILFKDELDNKDSSLH